MRSLTLLSYYKQHYLVAGLLYSYILCIQGCYSFNYKVVTSLLEQGGNNLFKPGARRHSPTCVWLPRIVSVRECLYACVCVSAPEAMKNKLIF